MGQQDHGSAARSVDPFVHLHTHTAHSKLDGLSRLDDLAQLVADDDAPAAATTDHGNLDAAFHWDAAARNADIKPIHGIEAYLAIASEADEAKGNYFGSRHRKDSIEIPREGGYESDADVGEGSGKTTKTKRYEHLTLLAATAQGWQNLIEVNNDAQDDPQLFYQPRTDFEFLSRRAEGLIALSGCLGGPVASRLLRGDIDGADRQFAKLQEIFGKDNVYVEIMEHDIAIEQKVTAELIALAKRFFGPAEYRNYLVATNDAHYLRAEDADAHDHWLCIGQKKGNKTVLVSEPNRFQFNGTGYHVRSAAEMRALFDGNDDTRNACNVTLAIEEKISDNVFPAPYLRLPVFPVAKVIAHPEIYGPDVASYNGPTEDDEGGKLVARKFLRHLIRCGAKRRYGDPYSVEVADRLNFEIRVIEDMGFPSYFLSTWELITWARRHGIRVGPGRGSAAGCAVSYTLGIVNVDPIENRLLFERFLKMDRAKMPDIDIDFDTAGGDKAVAHLAEFWGPDRVARIGTWGMSRSKKAIKDIARVSDRVQVGNELAKLVPDDAGKPLPFAKLRDHSIPAAAAFRAKVEATGGAAEIVDMAAAIENVVSGQGIHACGVLVSDQPFDSLLEPGCLDHPGRGLVPLRYDRRKVKASGGVVKTKVTQWDGKAVEKFGFNKVDVLRLRNLDVVSECVRLIEETTGEVVDADNTTMDPADPRVKATWELLSAGKTAGVFQVESPGMTRLCEQIEPGSLNDLSAIVALFRPGPLGAKMDVHYAARKRDEEPVDYGIFTNDRREQDVIASVLGDTYGTCIAKGQRVYSASRNMMVPIEDIEVGEMVQGVAADGRHILAPVAAHIDNGHRATVKLRFSSGRSLRVTADHRILTTRGWKAAGNLTPADSVAAPWRYLTTAGDSAKPVDDRDIAAARLLGWLLGDGSLTVGTDVYFVNKDRALLDAVANVGKFAFPDSTVARYPARRREVATVRFTGPGAGGPGGSAEGSMLAWLRRLGLKSARGVTPRRGLHSREKHVPPEYLAASEEIIVPLLAALWDCDGRIGANTCDGAHITYKTISRRLADDVAYLLLRLGITSTTTANQYTNANGSVETAYNLGVHQADAFVTMVAPYMESRAKVDAAHQARTAARKSRGQGSYVPVADILPIKQRVPGSWRNFCATTGLSRSTLRGGTFVGADVVSRLAELTTDVEMNRLASSQWQRVVSVENAAPTQVFDITVHGIHNFVAEGVVVHNCLYQEQLMQLSQVVAGFEAEQRNRLQAAFSKKIRSEMEACGELFVEGAARELRDESGTVTKIAFRPDTIERLWETFRASADYLFNKSHSAAYGYLTYITAYLKANWPSQYGAALLSCTDRDKADKRLAVLNSLRAEGIEVLPPSVNEGIEKTTAHTDGTVRIGLGEIKDVGSVAEHIIAERNANGPFRSLPGLMNRVKVPQDGKTSSKLPVTAVEGLIESGACDEFGPRMGMAMIVRAAPERPDVPIPDVEWGALERSSRERGRLGIILTEHPLIALRDQVKRWRVPGLTDADGTTLLARPERLTSVAQMPDRTTVLTLGVLSGWAEKSYSRGRMVNMTLEGSAASLSGTAWDETVSDMAARGIEPKVGEVIAVRGRLNVTTMSASAADGDADFDSDGEMEAAPPLERRELTVWQVYPVHLDDAPRFQFAEPAARADLTLLLGRPDTDPDEPDAQPSEPSEAAVPPVDEPTLDDCVEPFDGGPLDDFSDDDFAAVPAAAVLFDDTNTADILDDLIDGGSAEADGFGPVPDTAPTAAEPVAVLASTQVAPQRNVGTGTGTVTSPVPGTAEAAASTSDGPITEIKILINKPESWKAGRIVYWSFARSLGGGGYDDRPWKQMSGLYGGGTIARMSGFVDTKPVPGERSEVFVSLSGNERCVLVADTPTPSFAEKIRGRRRNLTGASEPNQPLASVHELHSRSA